MQAFTPYDVMRYVNAWGLPEASRKRLVAHLHEPALAGMARIPLLLAMLCDLAATGERLPQTRVRLYDKMLRRFLRSEHHQHEAESPRATTFWTSGRESEQRLLDVLAPVAAHFAGAPGGWVDRMPDRELRAALRSAPTFTDLRADPAEVLSRLSVSAGILIPAGDARGGENPRYLFAHRTFAEYLTATHLATPDGKWREAVRQHLWFDPEWEQVVGLLGGLLAAPEDLLDLLLEQSPDPLHHALGIAARVLAELEVAERQRCAPHAAEVTRRLLTLLDTPARPLAVRALPSVGPSLPDAAADALLGRLDELDFKARWVVLQTLANCPGEAVTGGLLDRLNDGDPEVRRAVVAAVADRPGEPVTAALLDRLNDGDPWVRQAAVRALAGRPDEAVTAGLLDRLNDGDPEVRRVAVGWLADRPGETVTAALLGRVADDDPGVRLAVAEASADRPGEAVTAALLGRVADDEPAVRRRSCRV